MTKYWLSRAYESGKTLLALVGLATLLVSLATFFGGSLLALTRDGAGAAPAVITEATNEPPAAVAGTIAPRIETPVEREQRLITEFIAKRYRVSDAAVADYVAAAYRAGEQYSLDPLLILAVMAVESRYNPVAESVVGAKGLMQVMPKVHADKLLDHGGEEALLEPQVNIQVGAQILREYQRRFRDTETALQMYAGAFDEPTSQYAAKVLAEKARLEVLRQKARREQSA